MESVDRVVRDGEGRSRARRPRKGGAVLRHHGSRSLRRLFSPRRRAPYTHWHRVSTDPSLAASVERRSQTGYEVASQVSPPSQRRKRGPNRRSLPANPRGCGIGNAAVSCCSGTSRSGIRTHYRENESRALPMSYSTCGSRRRENPGRGTRLRNREKAASAPPDDVRGNRVWYGQLGTSERDRATEPETKGPETKGSETKTASLRRTGRGRVFAERSLSRYGATR